MRATMRPGCAVVLVDIGAGGSLIESPRPMRPGARIHLQVAMPSRTVALHAHVLRCMVWSIDPLDGVRYRGALRFERRIDMADWRMGIGDCGLRMSGVNQDRLSRVAANGATPPPPPRAHDARRGPRPPGAEP